MIPKHIDSIEKPDIEALLEDAVAEGRTLDYKRELELGTDSQKKEFLADVSSLANASGGDIIFGVAERKDENGRAVPDAILGLGDFSEDTALQQIDQILLSGLAPRIAYTTRAINGFELGPVLLIRVRESWNRPHMVTFRGGSRFFSRTSSGKHQLDIHELRGAFALSESLTQRIQDFRNGRLIDIASGVSPKPLLPNPKVIVHFLPVTSFAANARLGLTSFEHDQNLRIQLRPIHSSYAENARFNFDGLRYFNTNNGSTRTYLQVYRDGKIEAVDASLIRGNLGEKIVPGFDVEREVMDLLARILKLEQELEFGFPIFISMVLKDVKDYRIPKSDGMYDPDFPPFAIDRDTLVLPEVMIESADLNLDEMMKPTFDAMWQASGWPERQIKKK